MTQGAPQEQHVAAAQTLDFSKPIAVLLIAVLHFVPEVAA